jgi:Na+/H+ antiporter NhaD/arsenite permease-like protein
MTQTQPTPSEAGAEKAECHISFMAYMKAYWWPMMITVTISMVYLLIAY